MLMYDVELQICRELQRASCARDQRSRGAEHVGG